MSDKKKEQLGINPSTAQHKLRKLILFSFVKRLGLDECYQCKCKIENVEELSIEHKVPWLDSKNPLELFFDLDNIAFSHLSCNVGAGRKVNLTKVVDGKQKCRVCEENKFLSDFDKHKSRGNGYVNECISCRRERDKKYKKNLRNKNK